MNHYLSIYFKSKYTNLLVYIFFLSFLPANTFAQERAWQSLALPIKASLRGSAINGNALWVSGSNNTVYVSQDGGQSWQNKSVKIGAVTDFRDIALFDKNTAIVMGAGEGESSVLYKTIDGGSSWQPLLQNIDDKGFFDAIAFWDKHTGLLLGDPTDGYYTVLKTQNGGKSWRRIAKTKLPKILEKEAAFAASGSTLLTGDNGKAWITTGGFSASVYTSTDYGESWQRQAVPLFQATQTSGGYGLALNSLQQLFSLGGDYQQRTKMYDNIVRLHQGEWQHVNAGKRGLRTAMSCSYAICIATGKTGNDISDDHGKTWLTFDDDKGDANDRGFYTIASDAGVFLAAGVNGKIGIYRAN
jgi:photosystem II stability/assembly factor-like uncharacterized protein